MGTKWRRAEGTPNHRLTEATLCSNSHMHPGMVHGEGWGCWDMAGGMASEAYRLSWGP